MPSMQHFLSLLQGFYPTFLWQQVLLVSISKIMTLIFNNFIELSEDYLLKIQQPL
jgi:hypothetical protein